LSENASSPIAGDPNGCEIGLIGRICSNAGPQARGIGLSRGIGRVVRTRGLRHAGPSKSGGAPRGTTQRDGIGIGWLPSW